MLKWIELTRFRVFNRLRVDGLTRVNLIVGRNNSGKTCLLEGVEFLVGAAHPAAVASSLRRRGEVLAADGERPSTELDVRHLFHGHRLAIGARLDVAGENHRLLRAALAVVPASDAGLDQTSPDFPADDDQASGGLALLFESGDPAGPTTTFRLSEAGGFRRAPALNALVPALAPPPVTWLGSTGMGSAELARLWDRVVLTPEEGRATDVLKVIEPRLARIAVLGSSGRGLPASPACFVRLEGSEDRLPLGSFGDGMRRLLAIPLAMAALPGGCFLVDEIDTGLHYSILEQLWRVVIEAARRLDIQVFATTHSGDCLRALAWLHESEPDLAADVSVHRVDAVAGQAVRYSDEDIAVAARMHIETRG